MEENAVRMKAYAIGFTEIHVYLSNNYYNGISTQFYLKNVKTDELVLLTGDALENSSIEGFREYVFHTSFHMGSVYKICDAYGLTCFLDFSRLSMCKEFDELYDYEGDDLGSHYTKEGTMFKVWAPLSTGVILRLIKDDQETLYQMTRGQKGVYEYYVEGDLDQTHYLYLVKHAGNYEISLDPYAYASSANGRTSIVVDLEKIRKPERHLPPLKKKTDMIIYETSVRDFSSSSSSGMKHNGQFLAFLEEGTKTDSGNVSGIDYLSELGVTHIQLMPINDFATVDESHPQELYNWGYDPAQYNVTEGSYVTQPNNGYSRIQEAIDMVDALHSRGLRVVLDVVYNHMHDINMNALEKTVPHYFFRRNSDGTLSNGSWCGNDLNTTGKMCRRYILNMCKRWQVLYGIDGYRFDLMGLIDIDTMKLVEAQGKAIDSSFVVYGEGWNMMTALDEDQRTTIQNNRSIPQVGFFNDFFRDTLKGTNQMENKGYFSGDTYKTNDAIKALCHYDMFDNISQSINYVECHDNATCYDKFLICDHDEDEETRKKRLRLLLAAVILAQGIPFIHSGQEFFRTKGGLGNTYNAGDQVNALDWNRKDLEIDTVKLVEFLIRLRKENPCFRYDDYEIMRENIKLNNIEHRMIEYRLHQDEGQYSDFIIYFNASKDELKVTIEDDYSILYHSEKKNIENKELVIPGTSMVILTK